MREKIQIKNSSANAPQNTTVQARCPWCGHLGTFDPIAGFGDVSVIPGVSKAGSYIFGLRRCPEKRCMGFLFFIRNTVTGDQTTFPSLRIDFDSSNVPEAIVAHLEEAITCHAEQCYTAAAIMIRRTLEELCRERGAEGKTLKDRIRAFGGKIIVPKELLAGIDELRLLGNDAAHVESEVFAKIGKEEVEVAIEFTKEMLKAVYQYSALLNKLRSLKEDTADST